VNASLVWLPGCPAVEFSRALGAMIADRLPTPEARHWRKALALWEEYDARDKRGRSIPEVAWPIHATLFAYPGKLAYGPGEPIQWELKLLGEHADHGLFLETILPAMEGAATTRDPRWYRQNGLWGRFDIQAVYAAHGPQWEPIVQAGQLDLGYRAAPDQWAEGLTFEAPSGRVLDRLTWITPFDLPTAGKTELSRRRKRKPADPAPTLPTILEALVLRLTAFLPGKYHTPNDVWDSLEPADRASLQAALEQAALIPAHPHNLRRAPRNWPGQRIGAQRFPSIPAPLVPYLELASILHIGKQTHFGCGTFIIA